MTSQPEISSTQPDNGSTDTRSTIGSAVASAAGSVRDVATDAAGHLPELATTTRSALVDVDRQMRSGSDEMLTIGSAISFGLAGGLLLAGANRLVIVAALIPATMMVLTLLDRSGSRTRAIAPRRLQGA